MAVAAAIARDRAGSDRTGAPDGVLQRARGSARVGFAAADGTTRLARLYQEGQAKIRLPRTHDGEAPVAVLINTAGGVTGGDRLAYAAEWGPGSRATVTSQAAERIYRTSGGAGEIETRLAVAAGASAEWLPQETILFDRSALRRRLDIDITPDATLVAAETLVFGRGAMGERVRQAAVADHLRVRRGGRLVFAESLRIDGDAVAALAGPATGSGATAAATILIVAPDAAGRLEPLRASLDAITPEAGVEAGASAFDGLLVARLLSRSPQALRRELVRVLETHRGRALPRVWSC